MLCSVPCMKGQALCSQAMSKPVQPGSWQVAAILGPGGVPGRRTGGGQTTEGGTRGVLARAPWTEEGLVDVARIVSVSTGQDSMRQGQPGHGAWHGAWHGMVANAHWLHAITA